MIRFGSAAVLAALFLTGVPAPAADTLDAVFARLDKAAATFKSLTADIQRKRHYEVINKDDLDEGTIKVKRSKPGDTRILIDFVRPDPQMIFLGGGKGQVYSPKANEVQEGQLGKYKNTVNQFLLLGFGSSSAELKRAYDVKFGGPETVNGVAATRIVLTPTDKEVTKYVKKCELWVPENGIPIQQKFDQGGGDYQTSTYSKMVLNPNLPDLKLDLPKGVKIDPIR